MRPRAHIPGTSLLNAERAPKSFIVIARSATATATSLKEPVRATPDAACRASARALERPLMSTG